MKKVYIASPYSNGDRVANTHRQLEAANTLMDMGYCPIVPLFSHYQNEVYPRPYEDWLKIDLAKLECCDIVLRLSGESPGADIEVEHANKCGIPVVHMLDYKTTIQWHCSTVFDKW